MPSLLHPLSGRSALDAKIVVMCLELPEEPMIGSAPGWGTAGYEAFAVA